VNLAAVESSAEIAAEYYYSDPTKSMWVEIGQNYWPIAVEQA
jgi:hypothetical protein